MKAFKISFIFILLYCHSYGQYRIVSISCPKDTTVCIPKPADPQGFLIIGGSPSGGLYSGNGVLFGTDFYPKIAGVGKHLITYEINNDSCTFYITVLDKPNMGMINSTDSVVCEGNTITYCINPMQYVATYVWNLTNSPLNNVRTPSPCITISFTNGYASGELTVRGVNKCDSSVSDPFHINLKPNPIPIIKNLLDSISAQDSICKNQQVNYYIDGKFDSCLWIVQHGKIQGDTIFGPTTMRTEIVVWDSIKEDGKLFVTVYNNGCTGSSFRNVVIGEGKAPNPSTIWLFGYNLLLCSDSSVSSYQWYYHTDPIPGATLPHYLADSTKPFDYWVLTCNESCCNESNHFNFFSSLNVNELHRPNICVYPNPASTEITIKTDKLINDLNAVSILNSFGIEQKKIVSNKNQIELDIHNFQPGLYIIIISYNKIIRYMTKFIKY